MRLRYIAMRLVQLIPLALVVTMVVFFVMMIVPGDPVMVMLGAVDGAQVSREVYDAMRARLGLDQPLIVQYFHWLANLLQGDLGTSITHRTAALEVILQRLVPTMYLMVGGLIMAVMIAVPGGVLAAIHNNTKWDHLATAFVVAGISVPTFWLALVAVLIFWPGMVTMWLDKEIEVDLDKVKIEVQSVDDKPETDGSGTKSEGAEDPAKAIERMLKEGSGQK